MKKIFTKEYMLANCGCYTEEKTIDLFFSNDNDGITIGVILSSDIPLKDKYWFVCRKTRLDKRINQQIAIDLAEIVLPIFERRYPDNKSPREAIEAAKQFIGGHISIDDLIKKRRAAAAAADAAADADAAAAAADAAADAAAAYAAYAAAAAADAAYAADAADADADADAAAAYADADAAAAYAAAAAAYAAAAAAYAAAAAGIKEQIKQYLIDFVSNQPETE